MILIQILLQFMLVTYVWAQSCPTKNLLTEKESPFNTIPVYNQDGSGTCYAYSASQLANYYLLKNKKTTTLQYHPLWVALKYAQDLKNKSITGGVADVALASIGSDPSCSYNSVSSSLQKLAKDHKMTDHEIIGFIETYSAEYNKLIKEEFELLKDTPKDEPKKIIRYELPPKMAIDNTYVAKPLLRPLKLSESSKIDLIKRTALIKTVDEMKKYSHCGEDSLNNLAKSLTPILAVTDIAVFKKLLFSECKMNPPNKLPPPSVFSPYKATDADYKKMLRSYFSEKSQPLGIRYCSEVLSNPNLDALGDDPAKARINNKTGKCGSHASVLVGARVHGKSCQYLLRNTWGAGYGSWTKNWSCSCRHKKTGSFSQNCKKETHPVSRYEVVGCWINESSLIKNIYGAQWLE